MAQVRRGLQGWSVCAAHGQPRMYGHSGVRGMTCCATATSMRPMNRNHHRPTRMTTLRLQPVARRRRHSGTFGHHLATWRANAVSTCQPPQRQGVTSDRARVAALEARRQRHKDSLLPLPHTRECPSPHPDQAAVRLCHHCEVRYHLRPLRPSRGCLPVTTTTSPLLRGCSPTLTDRGARSMPLAVTVPQVPVARLAARSRVCRASCGRTCCGVWRNRSVGLDKLCARSPVTPHVPCTTDRGTTVCTPPRLSVPVALQEHTRTAAAGPRVPQLPVYAGRRACPPAAVLRV